MRNFCRYSAHAQGGKRGIECIYWRRVQVDIGFHLAEVTLFGVKKRTESRVKCTNLSLSNIFAAGFVVHFVVDSLEKVWDQELCSCCFSAFPNSIKFINSLLIAQYFSTSSSLILTTDSSSIRLSLKRKTYQC